MKRKLFSMFILFVFLGSVGLSAQEVQEQAVEKPTQKVEPLQVKTWKVPPDLLKNLVDMITEFNQRFQETVEIYKAGLIATKDEFKAMPMNAILDIENGIFIDRLEYERLIKEAQAKLADPQPEEVKVIKKK